MVMHSSYASGCARVRADRATDHAFVIDIFDICPWFANVTRATLARQYVAASIAPGDIAISRVGMLAMCCPDSSMETGTIATAEELSRDKTES